MVRPYQFILLGSIFLVACSSAQTKGKTGTTSRQAASDPATLTPIPTNFETFRDPVEDAYTVRMPKGWQNRT